jgi:excisionase family DNA binding protein
MEGTNMAINQNPRIEPEWVSLREAAKIYAISTYTLRRRIASGDLPAVKLGYKLIRVRISDLDRLFPAIPTTRPEDRYRRW